MSHLSFIAHAYIWGGHKPQPVLPEVIAEPWVKLANYLGRPPILSYASYCLDNWYKINKQEPISLNNVALINNFLGGVDEGKKDLGEGIVVVFASNEDKVGVAVGITNKLTDKFDAVKFVKISSEIIGGQGGGGRKDFAQAGGQDQSKIKYTFTTIFD